MGIALELTFLFVLEWQGVPLRCEFGPRDLDNGTCIMVRRDNAAKEVVKVEEIAARAQAIMNEMQVGSERDAA